MGRPSEKSGSEDFPGRGKHSRVCSPSGLSFLSLYLSCVTWARQSYSEHVGLVTVGENSSVRSMVVPWCPPRGESFFFPCHSRRLGKEGVVPHSVIGPLWFLVYLFVRVRARPRYRATHWTAVLATACRCLEGYRTPDEAMVC